MNGTSPHIVQYQGSKRMLASKILQYMPNKFDRLIEPFSGMAAITIAVAMQKKTTEYIVNDLNAPLVNILREAVENPSALVGSYKRVWEEQFQYAGGSIEHYYRIRDEFNAGDKSAANMLYLLARCVKGSVRYSSSGQFNQSPDKRRNGTLPKNIEKNIVLISSMLKGKAKFMSFDYREVLKLAKLGDVVYMDPPYQGVCGSRDNRYFSGIDFDDFVLSIEELNRRNVDFIISYDGSCGAKQYGRDLPKELGLKKILLNAGLSSQSLLLGKKEVTCESLYLSKNVQEHVNVPNSLQLSMF